MALNMEKTPHPAREKQKNEPGDDILEVPPEPSIPLDEPEPDKPIHVVDAIMRPLKAKGFFINTVIGSLWASIPIYGTAALCGYLLEYTCRLIHRDGTHTVPRWKSFSDTHHWFLAGWRLYLVLIAYNVAIVFISGAFFAPFIPQVMREAKFLKGTGKGVIAVLKDSRNMEVFAEIMMYALIPLLAALILLVMFIHYLPLIVIFCGKERKATCGFHVGAMTKMIARDMWNFTLITMASYSCAGMVLMGGSLLSLAGLIPVIGWILSVYFTKITMLISGMIVMSAFAEFYVKNVSKCPNKCVESGFSTQENTRTSMQGNDSAG